MGCNPLVYVLKPGVSILYTSQHELILMADRAFKIGKVPEKWINWLRLGLSEEVSVDVEISEYQQYVEFLEKLSSLELICVKSEHNYIGTAWEKQVEFLSSHCNDANHAQQRISSHKAVVLGCGGTGSILIQNLVGIGVQNFHLIDPDIVRLENLNRQYTFELDDVGSLKVDCLSSYIKSRNRQTSITTSSEYIQSPDQLKVMLSKLTSPILLLCCADEPPLDIRIICLQAVQSLPVAVYFGNVGLYKSALGPFIDSEECRTRYLQYLINLRANFEFSPWTVSRASNGPLNAAMSDLMAWDIFLFLSGISKPETLGTQLLIDIQTLSSASIRINF